MNHCLPAVAQVDEAIGILEQVLSYKFWVFNLELKTSLNTVVTYGFILQPTKQPEYFQ